MGAPDAAGDAQARLRCSPPGKGGDHDHGARGLRQLGRSSGGKRVAVFRFLTQDWSPWIALLRMRERWPELSFTMKAGYLDSSET